MILVIFFCPKPQILPGYPRYDIILSAKHIHDAFPIPLLGPLWTVGLFDYIKDRFCYSLIVLFISYFLFWFDGRRVRRFFIILTFLFIFIAILVAYCVAFSILVISLLATDPRADFVLISIEIIFVFFFILF